MNSTSREIRRLNIKSFFNRRGLWRCYRCCCSCFLLFGQRASACTFDHLFVRLPSSCLEVCLPFVICLNISLPFIQLYCLSRIHPSFTFRNVLQHIEAGFETPLLVIRISKKTSPELEQRGILSAHALDLSFDECSRCSASAPSPPIPRRRKRSCAQWRCKQSCFSFCKCACVY